MRAIIKLKTHFPHIQRQFLHGTMLVVSLSFSAAAQAQLTPQSIDGANVVYDAAIQSSWTADANLLGTLEANAIAQNGSDASLIQTIINASTGGSINDTPNYLDGSYNNYDGALGLPYSGQYVLSAADFGSGGLVDWWGANAFVNYLNATDYAGSNQWSLPSAGNIPQAGYNATNSQLGELFYNELGGVAGTSLAAVNNANYSLFSNVQNGYWSGTENASNPTNSWYFFTNYGSQGISNKTVEFYAWAVSNDNVSNYNVAAVPLPGAVWLFGSVLVSFGMSSKRNKPA